MKSECKFKICAFERNMLCVIMDVLFYLVNIQLFRCYLLISIKFISLRDDLYVERMAK